jgi:hypothetical protein
MIVSFTIRCTIINVKGIVREWFMAGLQDARQGN